MDELKGMHVDHSANELAAGQQYILTLQDKSVLDYDEQDGDDANGEVLENIDLQQSFRQRIADRRKSKLQRHANSKMLPLLESNDEGDQVDGWNDPGETTLASGQAILSKYDDVEEVALKKKRANRIALGDKDTHKSGAESTEN